jgi:dynein heavy chain
VAAGGLAYLGAFTSYYREQLLRTWLTHCEEENIQTTGNFSLVTVLADPYEIRSWNTYGLPRDQVSTENAILVTQAGRWPLMIDPQEQVSTSYPRYPNCPERLEVEEGSLSLAQKL